MLFAFAVQDRKPNSEKTPETIYHVFWTSRLALIDPFEAFLLTKIIKRRRIESLRRNLCNFTNELLQRCLVTKTLFVLVKELYQPRSKKLLQGPAASEPSAGFKFCLP